MLREQKSLLEVTLRSIGEGVIVTDTEDRVTFINHVAQVLTGCSGEQNCGRPLEDIFRVSNTRHAHTADHVENKTLLGKDGTRRPVDASVASIVDERGIFHGKVVVFRDVSERQEAELRRLQAEGERENLLVAERSARADAERASRIKDEFLATLSHELRTPLSAILGYATLLRVANMNEQKMRHATEIIERNARLQAHLIDDLLDMNRIISGKIRLEIQDLQLPEIVAAALSAILPSLEAKQLKLETQIESDVGRVDGDPARIQQITWNCCRTP
jgi:PAS domain S-box-containing protein